MSATALNAIRIDTWRIVGRQLAESGLLTTIEVDILDVEGVDVPRNLGTWLVSWSEQCWAHWNLRILEWSGRY